MRSLLAALMLFSSSPALAVPVHTWFDPSKPMPTRRDFVQLLQRNGIRISYKTGCGRSGKALAVYSPHQNTMCLPETAASFDEALTHETVHVLQDCLTDGGLADSRMTTVHAFLRRVQDPGGTEADDFKTGVKESLAYFNDVPHIQHHYKTHHRDTEAEAYALEHNPRMVYDLTKTCFDHS